MRLRTVSVGARLRFEFLSTTPSGSSSRTCATTIAQSAVMSALVAVLTVTALPLAPPLSTLTLAPYCDIRRCSISGATRRTRVGSAGFSDWIYCCVNCWNNHWRRSGLSPLPNLPRRINRCERSGRVDYRTFEEEE